MSNVQLIYETKDYEMFKRLSGNRDLKSVKKILNSINEVGYVMSPIMVNEKMEVIDGQNRLEAFRSLNLPVHYYIVEGVNVEHARSLNIGRSNWTPLDYIKSYAETGNQSYAMLLKLMENHPELGTTTTVGVVKGMIVSGGGNASKEIANGEFEISKQGYFDAEEKLQYLDKFIEVSNRLEGSSRIFLSVIGYIYDIEGTDREKLESVILNRYPEFRPITSAKILFQDIEKEYNKRNKNKVYFYEEYLKHG